MKHNHRYALGLLRHLTLLLLATCSPVYHFQESTTSLRSSSGFFTRSAPGGLAPLSLGPLPLGATASAYFLLSGPLAIRQIESSCACESLELRVEGQEPISLPHRGRVTVDLPAGRSAEVLVRVPVRRLGRAREGLRLWVEGRDLPLSLRFSFEGVPFFRLRPERVDLGKVPAGGSPKRVSVLVEHSDRKPFRLRPAKDLPRGFTLELSPLDSGLRRWRLAGRFDPRGLPAGPVGGAPWFETEDDRRFRLPLSAWVEDEVRILPAPRLVFGLVPQGRAVSKDLRIEPAAWLRGWRLEGLPPGFLTVERHREGSGLLLRLRLSRALRPGSFKGFLVLQGPRRAIRRVKILGKILE